MELSCFRKKISGQDTSKHVQVKGDNHARQLTGWGLREQFLSLTIAAVTHGTFPRLDVIKPLHVLDCVYYHGYTCPHFILVTKTKNIYMCVIWMVVIVLYKYKYHCWCKYSSFLHKKTPACFLLGNQEKFSYQMIFQFSYSPRRTCILASSSHQNLTLSFLKLKPE